MSSGALAYGALALAVTLPASVAYGVGWVAWTSGRGIVEASKAVDRLIDEKKRQLAEAEQHRRSTALSAHSQLVNMCQQALSELQNSRGPESISSVAEMEQFKIDLETIIRETLPDDISQIESMTAHGYSRLERVVKLQKEHAEGHVETKDASLYRGISLADLMDDLKIAIDAMKIQSTQGTNVSAVKPEVLERVKLNEAFSEITAKIAVALDRVQQHAETYGLTAAADSWIRSCFNGIDLKINALCEPATTNDELKKGIRQLQDALRQYELMAPRLEKDAEQMANLYRIYSKAAKALGEPVKNLNSFRDAEEIEKQLQTLKKRAEKAERCAEIFKKLGKSAYLCYALDQELQAMGYTVHRRKDIEVMAQHSPVHAMLGENKLPFYSWTEQDLTQLYSMGSQCALQVIVHDDGTVSMQSIVEGKNDETILRQQNHCQQLKELYKRLHDNWFILYDFKETVSPERIMTVSEWRNSEDNAWKPETQEDVTTQRRKKQEEKREFAQ